jgi:hypothetical protein
MLEGEAGGFVAAQAAAEQQGQDHAVSFSLQRCRTGSVDQLFGLFFGQPVPCPDA